MKYMGPFACMVADPPWLFSDALPGESRGAAKRYKCMATDEIKRLILPPTFDSSYLFLWRVSAMAEEAYQVVRAWGFTPKSEIVWRKLTANGKPFFGMGRHVRGAHETCIIAVKGEPIRRALNIRSIFEAPIGEHSEKPNLFYKIVEQICYGPRVDVFARKERAGWVSVGDELKVNPITLAMR